MLLNVAASCNAWLDVAASWRHRLLLKKGKMHSLSRLKEQASTAC